MVRKDRKSSTTKSDISQQFSKKSSDEVETARFLSNGLFITEKKSTSSTPIYLKENEKSNLSVCLENEVNLKNKNGFSEDSAQKEPAQIEKPWGYYAIIDQGPHYKVKKIVVYPGYRLSLQMHYHRNEYWLVVKGEALVTVGDQTFFLDPNQSTYIPMQKFHRVENRGNELLEIIEVQNGNCISEEDIIRIEDDFNRSEII